MKKYYRLVWIEILMRLLFHFIYMCAIASLPYIIKYMIDCRFLNGYYDVVKWIMVFVGAILIGMVAQYISQKSAWKLDEKFYKAIRKDVFNEITTKLPSDFEDKSIGEYASEMNNNIASCEEYIEYIMQICESVIGLLVYAVYIFMLDVRIAIIIYLTAFATFFLPRVTGKELSLRKQGVLAFTGKYTNKLIDLLEGFSFINRFTRKSINEEHIASLTQMEESRYAYGSYKTFANVLNGSVMYMVNVAAFGIIAVLLCVGSITAGVATATISYIQDFMYPLRTIIDAVSSVKAVEGVKNTLIKQIEEARAVKDADMTIQKEIRMDQISIIFQDFEIRNFSQTFQKGKSYVIVGESGSGKSLLLKALTGRIRPDEGNIYVDGKTLDYDSSSCLMFYSEQKSHIFDASYMDNVTLFGSYEYDEAMNIFNDITNYSYLTDVKNCSDLSGGEKQLVLLNRAILSRADVMVLDEPFSAMNRELEYEVTKKLLGLKKTVIMITHNSEQNYLDLFDETIQII